MNKQYNMFEQINRLLNNDYDFKQDYKNKFEYVKSAHSIFKNIDYTKIKKDDLFTYTEIIDSILFKVIEVNNPDLMNDLLVVFINILEHFNENDYYRYSLEVLESINKHYGNLQFKQFVQQHSPIIIFHIENSKNYFFVKKNFHLFRHFCKAIKDIYKVAEMEVEQIEYMIGLTYHLEGIDQQGRPQKSSLVKANFLEQAEEHYKNKCQNIELAKDLRPLIKTCYGLVVENELHEFETQMPYTTLMKVEMYHYSRIYLNELNENQILQQLSVDKYLLPKYHSIAKSAKKIYSKSIFRHLFPTSPINNKRKLGTFNSSSEHDSYDILELYDINIKLIWSMRLMPIFNSLVHYHKVTPTSIMKHISNWSLVDKDRLPIIGRGIKNFFDEDYISSINTLVPQIEHQLRYMFELIGFSTTNTPNGKAQEEQTFSSFLSDKFVIQQLGVDIVKYFEILFTSKTGFNIRNNVAHGFFNTDNYSREMNIIVIYSLIILTRHNIKKIDSTEDI